ncbi:MAG: Asp-tRNA(Asn)/Glu-tRNA(Gln) amidotransferase subunit GatB, partial [Myxococcota bacterium]
LTPVIGLEIHVQLATARKLFSSARRAHDPDHPNRHIDPFSIGLPGALPVLNPDAVRLAVRVALALDCVVDRQSVWDRKHYFYPDLPKGFQITQHRRPLGTDGQLEILGDDGQPRPICIERVHMEEDAGKSVHGRDGHTRVDFNRAGAPLVEVVTAPALRSATEARRLLKSIRAIVRAVGASEAHMERGELRCDANVSLGRRLDGAKVEVKNLNSFRFVEQAIDHEIVRQREERTAGRAVVSETRLWSPSSRQTRLMRSKETSADYRYLPEPDLPAVRLSQHWLEAQRDALPERPSTRSARYRQAGLSPEHADTLAHSLPLAALFEAAHAARPELSTAVAALLLSEVSRWMNEAPKASLPMTPGILLELAEARDLGRISSTQQKQLIAEAWAHEGHINIEAVASVKDPKVLLEAIEEVLDHNPAVVDKYRAGKRNVIGFLMGAVMKATQGH